MRGNQADSLAVMVVLIKEDTVWNQMNKGRDSESIEKLRKAASSLARPYRGPSSPTVELELVLDQFIASVRKVAPMTSYYAHNTIAHQGGLEHSMYTFVLPAT